MHPESWQTRTPDLLADVSLYPSDAGGRQSAALLGWGCPCFAIKDVQAGGWDARLQLGNLPFFPGTERRVGLVFLSGQEAADALKQSGRFYLWELGFVGEAVVVR
ncbi:MAG: hypothetical protein ABIQ43_00595 [Sphingomonas sp.]